MNFKEPRKVEKNSVVLLRNIANESKREPMKLARVLQINESKDNAQRILTLEYNNIKKNKDGDWIGTSKIVERSINDVIPVDKAVNESMLNPTILEKVITDGTSKIDEEVIGEEDEEIQGINERNEVNDTDEITLNNDDSGNKVNDNDESVNQKQVRRSGRIKKQLVNINPEDIGDNDNENDEDYRS